jgi:hypothetical protein
MANKGSGPLIMLALGFVLLVLYFAVFGFSFNLPVKIGQYVAIAVVGYCVVDEFFR